jgi:hypothetical protein
LKRRKKKRITMNSHQWELALRVARNLVASSERMLKTAFQKAGVAKERTRQAKASLKRAKKESKVARADFHQAEERAAQALRALKKLSAKADKARRKAARAAKKSGAEKRTKSKKLQRDANGQSISPKIARATRARPLKRGKDRSGTVALKGNTRTRSESASLGRKRTFPLPPKIQTPGDDKQPATLPETRLPGMQSESSALSASAPTGAPTSTESPTNPGGGEA